MDINNRIETLLKEKGLTKVELASLMGTSKQNVNNVLKKPSYPTLEKIASALTIPLWQLFADPEDLRPSPTEGLVCPHCGKPINIKVEA